MAVTSQMRTQVAQLYVSLFGRAPEASGLGYWAQQLGNGVSLQQIAQDMFNVAPSRAYYPSFLTNEEIITKFYVNVLGRNPDAGGLAYWTGRLNTLSSTGTAAQKALAQGSVITEMLTAVVGYNGTDAAGLQSQSLFNNKVAVALKYAVEMNGDSIPDASTLIPLVTAGPNGQDAANAQITKIFNTAPKFATASVAASTLEDAAVTGKVTATDADAGDVLTYKLGTGPANGKVTVAADGSYSYVGNQDFNGADSFTVVVTDKSGATATQTVSVAVAAVNDAPVFAGASAAVSATEDTPINGKVTATDVDAGDVLSYKLGTAAANGKVTVAADGSYTYVGNQDFNGADSFTVIVTDKAGATSTQTVNVSVAAVNDAPVFTPTAAVSAIEDAAITGKVVATDVDAGDVLSYKVGTNAANGKVTVAADGTFSYIGNQDFAGVDSFTVVVTDKSGATATQTVSVNVAGVNDAPVFSGASVVFSGLEDTPITGKVVATDVDAGDVLTYKLGTNVANGKVTVAADGTFSYVGNQDFNGSDSFTVIVTDKAGVSATQTVNLTVGAANDTPVFGSASVTVNANEDLVFSGNLVATDVDTALNGDALTYSIATQATKGVVTVGADGSYTYKGNQDFNGTDSFTVVVRDKAGAASTQTVFVNVAAVNDTPVFATAAVAAAGNEDTAITGTIVATDVDIATNADALTFSLGTAPANGTVTVDANGFFSYKGNQDFNGADSFTVKVTDKSGAVTSQTVNVTVAAVNDAPKSVAAATASVAENTTAVGTYTTTDVDAGDVLAYSLSGTDAAKFNINAATGVVTFKTAPNFEVDAKSYAFNVVATDKAGATASQAVVVNVTDVNEAPNTVAAATKAVAENSTVVGTYATTDVDAGDVLTYTLSGADAAKFAIDAATGAVTFKTAPNFEVDAKSYAINVVATDKAGLSASQAVTVSVTDVNEAPNTVAAATVSVAENSTTVGTFATTDVDAADVLAYSLTGADAAKFNINAATGAVTFKTAPNFEVDAKSYAINVVATDKGGLTSTQAVTVNVTDVNEAPNAAAAAATANVAENSVAVGTYATTDVDAGDVLTYSLSGADAAKFNIVASTGVVTFKTAPNFEVDPKGYTVNVVATDKAGLSTSQALTIGVTNVNEAPTASSFSVSTADNTPKVIDVLANVSDVDAGDTKTIDTFTQGSKGTVALVDGKLVYTPGPGFLSGVDTFTYTAKDALGSTTGTPQTVTVTVNTENTAPVITANQSFTTLENGVAGTSVGFVAATDQEGNQPVNWTILSGNDAGFFTIDKFTGEIKLSATAALNFESANKSYTLTLQTQDSQPLLSSAQTVTINVSDKNEAPTAVAAATVSVAEKTTTVGTFATTDVDAGDALTYSLGGTDAAKFDINATTGAVTFKTAPNFEVDAKSYVINVIATDKGGLTSSQAVTVNVTDVNEAPNTAAAATVSVAENTTVVGTFATTDVDAGDVLAYTLSGTDAAKFNIDAATGAVTFKTAPNFEVDAKAYTFNVVATDKAGLTATQAVTVNVTDVNDNAPVFTSGATASVPENTAGVVYTATTTDVDTVGGAATYTITGGADAALFSINSTTGAVSFVAAPNFEARDGVANPYNITITATNGALTSTQAVVITVTDVNDVAPVLVTGTPLSMVEGTKTNNVDTGNTAVNNQITSTDGDATAAFKTVTYAITGGADAAKFSINSSTGALSFLTAPNFEAPGSAAGTNAYSVQVTGTNAGGLNPTVATIVVNVTDLNETPTFSSGLTTTAKTGEATVINLLTGITDQEGSALTATIVPSSLSAGGSASLVNGVLTYTSNVGYVGTETFKYTVSDGVNTSAERTVTVTVGSNIGGTVGNDTLFGSTAAENIDGLAGNDTIIGGGGLDTIAGGDGDDVVTFNDAASQINGGAGLDTLIVNADAVARIYSFDNGSNANLDTNSKNSQGNQTILRGFENLDATKASNSIIFDSSTTGAANTATGGGDTLSTTSVITGNSDDKLYFTRATGTVTVKTNEGADTIIIDNAVGGLHADGGAGSAAASGKFSIESGAGNDTIDARDTTAVHTIKAGAGNDTIQLGSGASSIEAGEGNDTISGGAGAGATLKGDAGDDQITGGSGAGNSIYGGDGNDTITVGNGGTNYVEGGAGNDSITGGTTAGDTIKAGDGDDTVVGTAVADNFDGGTGTNEFQFTFANLGATDTITGTDGTDTLKVTAITDGKTLTVGGNLTKVTAIETLNVTGAANASYTVAVADQAGLTSVVYNEDTTTTGKDFTVTGLTTGASVTLVGEATAGANNRAIGNVTISKTTATATNDALTVKLVGNVAAAGAGSNNNVTKLTTTGYELLTIDSGSSGAALTTALTNQNVIATLDDADLTTLTLTGASALTLGSVALTPTSTTINAGAMTGALDITVSGTSAVALTGGSANDTLSFGTTLLNTDTVIGNGGTDTVKATINGTTATTGKFNITTVENVDLTLAGASTVDASLMTTGTVITLIGNQNATVTGLAANATTKIGQAGNSATATHSLALADATGTADVLNVQLNSTAAQTVTLTSTGVETLNISAAAGVTQAGTQALTVSGANAATINVSGALADINTQAITMGTLNAATTKLDGSGLLGSGTFSATASATATTLIGGSGNNNFTGGAAGDTITISTKFDGSDTVDGAAGTDTLSATVSAANATLDLSNVTNVETVNLTVAAGIAVTATNVGTAGTSGLNDAEVTTINLTSGSATSSFVGKTVALGGAGLVTVDASNFAGAVDLAVTDLYISKAASVIKGGSGTTDVLHASLTAGTVNAVTISGYETVQLNATVASTIDASKITGVSTLVLNGAEGVTVNSLAAGTAVSLGLPGTGVVTNNALGGATVADNKTFTFNLASITGTADALTVNLNDQAAITNGITIAGNGIENWTFNQSTVTGKNFSLAITDTNANNVSLTFTGGFATAGTDTTTIRNGGIQSNVTTINAGGSSDNFVMAAGARVGTSAMTITGGTGADTIIMKNAADVLDAGAHSAGGDTLSLVYSAVAGAIVDLNSTTDQVTLLNGTSNAAVQKGFENADLSGYVGGGVDITFAAGGSKVTGSAGSDVVRFGAGTDVFKFVNPTANGTDQISGFTAGTVDKLALFQGASAWNAAGTAASTAGTALAAADYEQTRAAVTNIAAGDDLKLVELQTAQTTAQITTGLSGAAANAYVLVFNSTTGVGEIWYDTDWSNVGGRVQVATLTDVTTLVGVTNFTEASFLEYL